MEPDGDSDDGDRDSPTNDKKEHHRPAIGQLPRADSNRTLVDVIRDEGGGPKDGKRNWRHFKEKLKHGNIHSRGAAWTPTVPVPTSDIPINGSRNASRHPSSTRIGPMLDAQDPPDKSSSRDMRSPSLARNSSRFSERASGRFDHGQSFGMRKLNRQDDLEEDEEEEEEEEEEDEEEAEEAKAPVRMSLMSLLMDDEDEKEGIDGLAYMMEDEDDDDEDEEEEGGEYTNCCVCMVRHKGSSFVPCGHSFCRLCSREMWVEERGSNCPLCNNYILEILDIF